MPQNKQLNRQSALEEYQKTHDILRLQKALGHKSVRTTLAYLMRSKLLTEQLEK